MRLYCECGTPAVSFQQGKWVCATCELRPNEEPESEDAPQPAPDDQPELFDTGDSDG